MNSYWTPDDYALQWLWVAVIALGAVILVIRAHRRRRRRRSDAASGSCADCPVKSSCKSGAPDATCPTARAKG